MTSDRFQKTASVALAWLDALVYAVAVAGTTALGALMLGVVTGGGLVRAKLLLFLAGFGLMGYATVRLWPPSPENPGRERDSAAGPSRLQRVLTRLLPGGRFLSRSDRRLAPPSKLFVGSLLVLGTSFLMEAVLGVG